MRPGPRPHAIRNGAVTGLSAVIVLAAAGLMLAALLASPGERTPASNAATRQDGVLHVGGTGCRDSGSPNDAANPATPWCTPAHALEAAPAGSVVALAPGRYPQLRYSGQARSGVVTLRGAAGGRSLVAGADLRGTGGFRLEGMVFTDQVNLRNVDRVRLQRNELRGAGVVVTVSRNVAIARNSIHDLRGEERGIYLRGDFRPGRRDNENVLVQRNRITRVQHDAIAFYNGYRNAIVEGNVIRRAIQPAGFAKHTDGMQFMGGDSLVVRDNVIRDSSKEGMIFKDGEPSRHLVVQRNVVFNIAGPGIQVYSAPGARIDHNTVWSTKFGSFLGNDPAVKGSTRAAVTANVFDRLTQLSPGLVSRASRNVFATGTPVGNPAYRGRPNFVDAKAGDLRIRRTRPGANLPRGRTPPGAQRRAD